MKKRLLANYPALQNRNFRLFFFGQLVSFTGTWIQGAAQGWLVFQLTHSAFAVGFTGFMLLAPTMCLAPFGGVVVDRFRTRAVLYCTTTLGMLQAFVFAALVATGHVTPALINALAFALGLINALDAPARHTCIPEIVEADILPSALAMQSTLVNLGLIMGSSAAGFLVAYVGMAATFFVNGISFLPVLITLALMDGAVLRKKRNGGSFSAGARYAAGNERVRLLLGLIGFSMALGYPYRTMLPAIAREVLHVGPEKFGFLMAAPGVGSILGALIVSRASKRLPIRRFVIASILALGATLVAFSFTRSFALAAAIVPFAGAALTVNNSTLRSALRSLVQGEMPEMLGRVTGFDVMMFFGGSAVGNFLVGWAAEGIGVMPAIGACGLVLIILGKSISSRKGALTPIIERA
ncbi:MAG: MFS transporter [Patescibacteria group bacterium]|nr:MFS transporter [Patescibacteria group bacterium]